MTEPTQAPNELAAMTALEGERTVEQIIARDLRTAILDGRLSPGTRLPYRDVATQLNVSVTPVRIALRELVNEGLVELRARGGARVAPLSAEELEEIYATRIGLEGWLAWCGAPRLGKPELAALDRALAAIEASASVDDREAYLEAVWNLRATCYRAARRPRLLARVEQLYARSARYNWLILADRGRMSVSLAGARGLHAACRDRDGARAREAIRTALDQTMDDLIARFTHEQRSQSEE